jgi:hypothetical protein
MLSLFACIERAHVTVHLPGHWSVFSPNKKRFDEQDDLRETKNKNHPRKIASERQAEKRP